MGALGVLIHTVWNIAILKVNGQIYGSMWSIFENIEIISLKI